MTTLFTISYQKANLKKKDNGQLYALKNDKHRYTLDSIPELKNLVVFHLNIGKPMLTNKTVQQPQKIDLFAKELFLGHHFYKIRKIMYLIPKTDKIAILSFFMT